MPAALTTTLCAVCRRWGDALVCRACVQRHAAPAARCERCALRWLAGASVCIDCARAVPPQSRTVCGADYAFPWHRLVRDFKFNGHIELAAPLSDLLLRALAAQEALPELIVPVPLSRQRLSERGYNQAWLIAQRLARRQRLAHRADVLHRCIDTREQAGLDRAQRQGNLRDAFAVLPGAKASIQGRSVAVVDDVMTTGATLAECARVLLAAGAASVVAWVVARTAAE